MNKYYQTNSVRGPMNSWIFNFLENYMDRLFGQSKASLFENHPLHVVEIGPGTGANMRYYRRGTTVLAIEPNIHMHENLKRRAKEHGIKLVIWPVAGELIDLADSSCEFVVCTLVLCTVQNPAQCVSQIKRILKPNGTFVFIEHVAAKGHGVLSLVQKLVHKPWHWFFEGCHINRDTAQLIKTSGFRELTLDSYNLYSPLIPIIPQIRGKAIK